MTTLEIGIYSFPALMVLIFLRVPIGLAMLVGLVEFETTENIGDLPGLLKTAIAIEEFTPLPVHNLPPRMQQAISDGQKLWKAMQQADAQFDNELIAEVVLSGRLRFETQ